jgi:pre-mRNA-splicing factor ATP-dependent RNA helicase DHX38/PRP16
MDAPRGIGDFQRRSNQARDRGWSERDDRGRDAGYRNGNGNGGGRREWDAATSRTERGGRDDAPSVRIPNAGWDATPRRQDAPTPRGGGGGGLESREWEEEQIRLDRDWYAGAEEGALAGDDAHNPLAQYEDLGAARDAELETKRVKRVSARQAQYVRAVL